MTVLELGPRCLRFLPRELSAAIGPQSLVDAVLRHAPPTALEAETAIEVIEDAVMPLHRQLAGSGELRVRGARELQALVGLSGPRLDAEAIEALFTRAAAVTQGRPATSEPVLAQPAVFACLLILREVLHHLGFSALRLD
jgi:hypothetical protein